MFDLKDLSNWVAVKADEKFLFPEGPSRSVTLEFRVEGRGNFWLVSELGEMLFLLNIDSHAKISVRVPDGRWAIMGDCNWHCATMESRGCRVVLDNPSFARVVERRARNPEMELMFGVMARNMERRLEAISADSERRLAEAMAAASRTEPPAKKPAAKVKKEQGDGEGNELVAAGAGLVTEPSEQPDED